MTFDIRKNTAERMRIIILKVVKYSELGIMKYSSRATIKSRKPKTNGNDEGKKYSLGNLTKASPSSCLQSLGKSEHFPRRMFRQVGNYSAGTIRNNILIPQT